MSDEPTCKSCGKPWHEHDGIMRTCERLHGANQIVDAYATAARSIALNLREFCDESLSYDEMIADAARKARTEIERLQANVAELLAACDLAVRYLDHPEIHAIPFALPVANPIERMRAAVAKANGGAA